MRSFILPALLAAVAFVAAPLYGADETPKATNKTCCCGKPVDAAITPVTVTVDGKTYTVACCSKECADAIKADPKKFADKLAAAK